MTSDTGQRTRDKARQQPAGEQGFMLLGLIVATALILIALSVAASRVAFSLRREREVESAHRANQYVRAIQLYYKKFGHYPASIEQLENSNGTRYLRKRYVDPLTGKADYRLIGVGQNQTTVKGFFGEPLTGIAAPGLGAAAGMAAPGLGGTAGAAGAFGAIGTAGANGMNGANGANGINGANSTAGTNGMAGANGAAAASGTADSSSTSGLGSAGGMQSQSATGFSGSGGPFMGVGSSASGNSIIAPNEQTTYQTWEFLYDPRIELLKLAATLNGGAGLMGGGALGQSPSSMGQPSSGFGQSPGGFGQSPSNSGQTPQNPGGTNQPTSP